MNPKVQASLTKDQLALQADAIFSCGPDFYENSIDRTSKLDKEQQAFFPSSKSHLFPNTATEQRSSELKEQGVQTTEPSLAYRIEGIPLSRTPNEQRSRNVQQDM